MYLGVFDRSAIETVGLFDERLIRNQDDELNVRLREAGYTVWFDPDLGVRYRPRGSWRALWRQYGEYGFWKAATVRLHPSSLRLRQLAPPLALGLIVAAMVGALRDRRWMLVPGAAVLGVASEAGRVAVRSGASGLRVAGVLASIPTCWAIGLAAGAVRDPLRSRRRRTSTSRHRRFGVGAFRSPGVARDG